MKKLFAAFALAALAASASAAGIVEKAFAQPGVGAVSRSFLDKARDVINVKDFGATCNTAAVQAAVNYAFTLGKMAAVDLGGRECVLDSAVSYPAGGGVILQNGTLKASTTFPTTDYLVKAVSQSGGLVHHDIGFENLVLDANHRGGGLRIDNYIRVNIDKVTALHFSTTGILLEKTIDSHEAIVRSVWAFEYLYGETGYLTPTASSVGMKVDAFDNQIDSFVSYYTGTGLVINGQYNQVSKAHLGGGQYALKITQNASFSSFVQPYVDSAAVLWENPWHTEIIGGKFLHNTADASFSFIVLKPLSAGLAINGVKIKNSSFHNIGSATVKSVSTDTSSGTFNAAWVENCFIGENSFSKATYAYTRMKSSLYQNAATGYVFNLDGYFPFGQIQHALASFYDASGVNPITKIQSISGNTVAVENSIAGNGTMFIEVDVNTGTM